MRPDVRLTGAERELIGRYAARAVAVEAPITTMLGRLAFMCNEGVNS
jgi:hypothetical protein